MLFASLQTDNARKSLVRTCMINYHLYWKVYTHIASIKKKGAIININSEKAGICTLPSNN